VNKGFVRVVQSAMRSVAVCPACGRRIVREEGVRYRGKRHHRACVRYRAGAVDGR
jgi:predicted RNA-binding Zn-ribbon protein involved in translation (DUF1610 family)